MAKDILDVAVVGGGVSGIYSAWRLQAARPDLKIALFEYSDRIGGRLYSKALPGMPSIRAELGGMRYIPKAHALVAHLVQNLNLPTTPFWMGKPTPSPQDPSKLVSDASENIYHLRQKSIRQRELAVPGVIPYAVSWNERGLDPDQLQAKVLDYLIPNNPTLSTTDWFDVKVFGRELYKFGFWDLLSRVLTSEAYTFMKDAGGYDSNVANANAVSQLPVGEYGAEVEFRTLREGYEELPRSMAASFESVRGKNSIRLKRRLTAIDRAGELYRLHFAKMACEDVEHGPNKVAVKRMVDDEKDNRAEIVHARRVILAMPRRSLELVEWDGWKAIGVRQLIESVLMQAAFKLFLGYEAPWWRALGLHSGRSITDLPIRQVYYFQTERDQPGGDPKNWNSLLMASYNDLGTVPYWKGTENDDAFTGHSPAYGLPTGQEPVIQGHNPVTKGMVELAQAQLAMMHSQITLPRPYTAVYHDWTDDPFGGGWHEWKAGVRFNEVMPKIRKPVVSDEVYVCGEAYSNNQGWVEGALQTAEKMLQDHFQLDRPGWLPSSYDPGW